MRSCRSSTRTALAPVPSFATVQFEPDPHRPLAPEGRGDSRRESAQHRPRRRPRLPVPHLLSGHALAAGGHGREAPPAAVPSGAEPAGARERRDPRCGFESPGRGGPRQAAVRLACGFHLAGENTLTAPLYDLLHNHALEVAFTSPERPKAVVTLAGRGGDQAGRASSRPTRFCRTRRMFSPATGC